MFTRPQKGELERKRFVLSDLQQIGGNEKLEHSSSLTVHNTHIQIIEGLVDRLIALGKPFDYRVYLNRYHGLQEGDGTTVHAGPWPSNPN